VAATLEAEHARLTAPVADLPVERRRLLRRLERERRVERQIRLCLTFDDRGQLRLGQSDLDRLPVVRGSLARRPVEHRAVRGPDERRERPLVLARGEQVVREERWLRRG
jgi:hypothetical protein